jgi:hypothetical protein
MRGPEIWEKLVNLCYEVFGLSGPEFAAGIKTQIARLARIIKATG